MWKDIMGHFRKFRYAIRKIYYNGLERLKPYSMLLLVIGLWVGLGLAISQHRWIAIMTVSGNYLRIPETNFYTGSYLVFTPKCRIPDLKAWTLHMLSNVEPLPALPFCDIRYNSTINGTIKGLTSVDKETLLVNQAALIPLGLMINDISCCYQVIERVEQTAANYSLLADIMYRFSGTCYPMKVETQPISGFVRVTCYLTRNRTNKPHVKIHTDFHMLAIFPNESNTGNLSISTDNLITRKLEYWKKRSSQESSKNDSLPPNVLIIGLDSTSRLNLKRVLPRLESLLKKGLQAVELKGYAKVGLNTLPNLVPLLTSYSIDELKDLGFGSRKMAWDNCSLIWKNFSDHNYLTAYIEDSPLISTFNFLKTGFVEKPTDIYPRPWIIAAHVHNNGSGCVGYQRTDQVYFQYIQDLVGASVSRGIPFYIFSWFNDNSHDTVFGNRVIDTSLTAAILQMSTSGLLDNTVLVLMSDHGVRFMSNARQSLSGWYEDNLPTLWIKVGDKVKKGKEWVEGLRQNSNQLVTVYDIYQTWKTILEESHSNLNATTAVKPPSKSDQMKPPPRGLTLFKKVPDRSCEEAGVGTGYCTCAAPVEFKGSRDILENATRAVIENVNSEMIINKNRMCDRVKRYTVTAAAILPTTPVTSTDLIEKGEIQEQEILGGNAYLICGINIFGGRVQMEVQIGFNASSRKFYQRNIFLTNRISKLSKKCLNYS